MKKDILEVICGTAVLSVVMDIVFLIIGRFNMGVLWGSLLGFVCASLNFVLLSITLHFALSKEKNANAVISVSYFLRLILIAAAVIFAMKSEYINWIAAVIPLVFPRLVITVIQGIVKHRKSVGGGEIGRT